MWQGVSPVPVQMWQGVSPVPVQMWQGVSQVPVQMWQGVSQVPVQMWQGVSPVPVQMWQGRCAEGCPRLRDTAAPVHAASVPPPPAWLHSALRNAACVLSRVRLYRMREVRARREGYLGTLRSRREIEPISNFCETVGFPAVDVPFPHRGRTQRRPGSSSHLP